MKKYNELSASKQQQAVEHCVESLYSFMAEEDVVPDCLDDFEDVIRAAMAEAERLHTPWFFLDILQSKVEKNPEMKQAILQAASQEAQDAWYPDAEENVIYLPTAIESSKLN